ncbi:unnamed protein product [Alopecurus aequalis]
MATAPPALPPLPAVRRGASAIRRFPPGCGRKHRDAAQPPLRLVPVSFAANDGPPPNPTARAAAKTSSAPAARLPGTEGHNRGRENGPMSRTKDPAAAEVVVHRLSAVRRYPPGCGRGFAVPKPEASAVACEGEGGAIELLAEVCDVEAQAIDGDQEVVPSASTLDNGEANSDGVGCTMGEDGGSALEGCGGGPSIANGTIPAPLVPWAQHGQRSQQRRKTF